MNKPNKLQMAAPQNYSHLNLRTLEIVDLQNGWRPCTFLTIEHSKRRKMFLTTFPRILTIDFLKFCLYVEKIDIEVGPR